MQGWKKLLEYNTFCCLKILLFVAFENKEKSLTKPAQMQALFLTSCLAIAGLHVGIGNLQIAKLVYKQIKFVI